MLEKALATPTMSDATHRFQTDEARWQALLNRDAEAEGVFFYSVRTTGVYCRPTCAARSPLRENVAFHESRGQAEAAGFRPCKRCKPHRMEDPDEHTAMIEEACRLIETAEEPPSLGELAESAGFSPFYFHRLFKRHTGVTPKAYAQAHRGRRIQSELGQGGTVTAAIYEAGYQTSSRFYEEAGDRLGMTPTQFKRGGAGKTIRYAIAECPLGLVLIAATEKGICQIHFGDDRESMLAALKLRFGNAELRAGDPAFDQWVESVLEAIAEGRGPNPDLPLDIRGTAFQQRVWQALREIPAGRTATYAQVAAAIGKPTAARAVARACAENNLAVAVPCHRVIRADGSLSGYRWGKSRKRELLAREARS